LNRAPQYIPVYAKLTDGTGNVSKTAYLHFVKQKRLRAHFYRRKKYRSSDQSFVQFGITAATSYAGANQFTTKIFERVVFLPFGNLQTPSFSPRQHEPHPTTIAEPKWKT